MTDRPPPDTTATVAQAYADVSGLYIDLFASESAVHADDVAFIARHLAEGPGPVLDVGCGPGHLTAHLRSLGVDASGVDVVPDFIAHARATHSTGAYEIGDIRALAVADASTAGLLAWYSLIDIPPQDLDPVLAVLRRAITPGGILVLGFFVGEDIAAFDHKVTTAYRWPIDALASRLRRAGFREIDRLQRPAEGDARPHGALAATAD